MIGTRISGALLPLFFLAIGVGSSWSIYRGLQPVAEPVSPAGVADNKAQPIAAIADEPELAMPPPAAFAAIVERPLFSAGRRLTKASPQPEVPKPQKVEPVPDPVRPLNLSVKGIVVAGEDSFALVVPSGGGEPVRLTAGDRHAGWTLTEIVENHVVFKRDAREATLVLQFDGMSESRTVPPGPGGMPSRRRGAEQPTPAGSGIVGVRRRGS